MTGTVFDSSPADERRYGVAIVANDKVIEWLLPFLESDHDTNASSRRRASNMFTTRTEESTRS
jgi:hypothetical protein